MTTLARTGVTSSVQRGGPGTVVAVLGVMAKIWCRRAQAKLPGGLVWVVLGALVCAVAALWLWVVPTVVDLLRGVGAGDPQILQSMLVAVVMTLALNVALIQTLLLSFDHVSTDLVLIIESAPLGRFTKSSLYVLPEAVLLGVISFGLASIAIVGYALADDAFSVWSALALTLLVMLSVGALTSGLSAAASSVIQDLLLARLVATLFTLGVLTVLSFATARSIQSPQGLETLSQIGGWLRGIPTLTLATVALVGGTVLIGLWLASATGEARRAFHVQGRETRVRSTTCGLVGASGLSYLREPTNISGLLGLLGIAGMAFALGSWFGTDVALALLLACAVMGVSFSAVMAYGDYLALRWRVVVSPMPTGRACGQWILGHLVAGTAVVLLALAVLLGVWSLVFQPPGRDMLLAACVAGVCGVGGGVVGGWLVPYEKDDMVGVVLTGSITALLGGGIYYLTGLAADGPALHLLLGTLVAVLGGWLVCAVDGRRGGLG